jgi:hypothetical protein
MAPTPFLRDPTGRIRIGPGTTPAHAVLNGIGATSILYGRNGGTRGVYVDNETGWSPVGSREQRAQRDTVARQLRAGSDKGLVVVGLWPDEPGHRINGCVCMLQWYPYGLGYAKEPLPKAEAYTTQWFFAHAGKAPPTVKQRNSLLARAWAKRPSRRMVWVY